MSRPSSFAHRAAVVVAVVLAGLAIARPASAQEIAWSIVETMPGEPTEKDKNPAPMIKVKIVGEPMPKADEIPKFLLKQVDGKPKKGVAPIVSLAVPYHKSNETIAVVVLVEGHQMYFGNDKYVEEAAAPDPANPDAPRRIVKKATGVYDTIAAALDAPNAKDDEIPSTIPRAGPKLGSKGALIVYSAGADIRYPMGDLAQLTGDKLGEQKLQQNKTSRELSTGLKEAYAQLKKASTTRKVLFLISDGHDDSGNAEEIRALQKQFANDKIDVFAFHLESTDPQYFASDQDQAVKTQHKTNMQTIAGSNSAPNYHKVKDAADLAAKIGSVVTGSINNRYWLTFPGEVVDPKTKLKSGFTWDEKEHDLMLERDGVELSEKPITFTLAPKWGQSKGGSLWWLWIAIPGGILLLGVLIMLFSGKKQPEPMPMPMPMPVAAPPPQLQPAPATSNKTMAINISSGDGVPVVGWIVPINGPQAFQTFKMVAGVTKVGNTQGAHILINDGFMSGDHAHIAMAPHGFTLIDNNSTNGTFVNERRIQRHELIDNDVIKFGKTDCKFKTILG